jgi:hypothetical protein
VSGYLLWAAAFVAIGCGLGALSWWLYDRWDWIVVPWIASIVGCLLAVIALICGLVNAWSVTSCEHQGDLMGLDWNYSAWTPCLLQLPDGRWIDADNIENDHLTGEVTLKRDDGEDAGAPSPSRDEVGQ